jgi:serine/threonine protein kinase
MALWTSPKQQAKQFGNYTVLELLGSGGMGSVYKCRHVQTQQIVAVKLLRPDVANDPAMVQRFEQEFHAASRLVHPNVVRVLEFGRDDSTCYLVMEHVDGLTLWDRIDQKGKLPEAEAVAILVQVAQALHQAHQIGLIHRDIKPDNILLTSEGQAKLADLGCVKDLSSDLNLTRTRQGLGTPNFMAVEQFRDAKNVDPRCDVYSLGATLYMAVTGKLPFETRRLSSILAKKLKNDITPARQLAPNVSEQTERAIHRALRAKLEERPQSCLEFIADLSNATPVSPRVATPVLRPRKSSAATRPVAKERRTSVRHSSALCGLCQPAEGEEDYRWSALIKNISAVGIAVVLPRRFEPGTTLFIEVGATRESPSRTLLARVVHLKPCSGKRWEIGCALVKTLQEDQVKVMH